MAQSHISSANVSLIHMVHTLNYEISTRELKELLAGDAGKTCVLLDVREPWEHQEARIEGSTLMPMGDVPARAHQELDLEARIVAICHHGVRSMSVVAWLREQGFENAQSLRGGIDAWSEIDSSVPRY
jgi:rhodanese-related sulfurtransferase